MEGSFTLYQSNLLVFFPLKFKVTTVSHIQAHCMIKLTQTVLFPVTIHLLCIQRKAIRQTVGLREKKLCYQAV